MKEKISEWFEAGAPFNDGVTLYMSLPITKPNVIRSLKRGKNSYNKSLLIKELRQAKATPPPPKPAKRGKKSVLKTPATDAVIHKEHVANRQKDESAKREFNKIKYNELPAELKVRFREAKDIFYNLCDLKVALNDVPAASTKEALAIQLQIEELDDQRKTIWKELEHWKNHKTLLPSTAEDFTSYTPGQLYKKKGNLASNITKTTRRINNWYDDLEKETNAHKQRLIENKINKAEKSVHQHRLNILKIDELL